MSNMLNVANQTEFHISHYVSITLYVSIEHTSRQFIPFAVAANKFNILVIPFFEEY